MKDNSITSLETYPLPRLRSRANIPAQSRRRLRLRTSDADGLLCLFGDWRVDAESRIRVMIGDLIGTFKSRCNFVERSGRPSRHSRPHPWRDPNPASTPPISAASVGRIISAVPDPPPPITRPIVPRALSTRRRRWRRPEAPQSRLHHHHLGFSKSS